MRISTDTRRLLTGALASLVAGPLVAQTSASPKGRRSELPAAYAAIREADLRRDVGEMASPAMRGREGGTIDEMRASMWVAEQYRRIGLKPMGDDGTLVPVVRHDAHARVGRRRAARASAVRP